MPLQPIGEPWHWAAFVGFVLLVLALDLGVFHRRAHEVSVKEAAIWTLVWVALAGCFNLILYHQLGPQRALEFATGYVIEKALAVDNIFVFILVFSTFAIPLRHQHRVLFWGILGALLMRGIFVALGSALLTHFHWALYVFGAFLALTGAKLLISGNDPPAAENNPIIVRLRRVIPVATTKIDGSFFHKQGGKWMATPLLVALVAIELSDIVFAIDSIPAIFAVTREPFIVFTSNMFAILGLRSLYFLLASVIDRFVYLKTGLAAVLLFVGTKMLLVDIYKVPVVISLGVIVTLLAASVVASWLRTGKLAGNTSPVMPEDEHLIRLGSTPEQCRGARAADGAGCVGP